MVASMHGKFWDFCSFLTLRSKLKQKLSVTSTLLPFQDYFLIREKNSEGVLAGQNLSRGFGEWEAVKQGVCGAFGKPYSQSHFPLMLVSLLHPGPVSQVSLRLAEFIQLLGCQTLLKRNDEEMVGSHRRQHMMLETQTAPISPRGLCFPQSFSTSKSWGFEPSSELRQLRPSWNFLTNVILSKK